MHPFFLPFGRHGAVAELSAVEFVMARIITLVSVLRKKMSTNSRIPWYASRLRALDTGLRQRSPARDPLLPLQIGPMNGREARESGLRLKA
jgi:hypothetical protein